MDVEERTKLRTGSSLMTNREEPQLQIQTHLGSKSDQREGAAAPDRLVGGTYFTMGGAYRATSHHCRIKFGTLFDPVGLQENYHPSAILLQYRWCLVVTDLLKTLNKLTCNEA